MEEIRKKASVRLERLPGEVVGYYRPDADREVVGVLTHEKPLPGKRETEASPAQKTVKRKKKTGLWLFLLCMAILLGVALAAFFWPREQSGAGSADKGGGSSSGGNPGPGDFLPGMEVTYTGVDIPTAEAGNTRLILTEAAGKELTAQEVYARVNPSVVTVMVETVGGSGSVGTGVIFTEDGYMLTNYHVISGGYSCTVATWDNARYTAFYVAGDEDNDIAVLKIDARGLIPAEIGDSAVLAVGDAVYAIGSPLGTELRGTFTNGIVSALDRDVDVDGRTMILLQTNTALNSGNSGGPLINAFGQVVGINTIKMMSDYSTVEGLGFAIPTDRLQKLVNELLTQGHVSPEPLLGITVETLGTKLPDGTVGALIVGVSENSAAGLAGLRAGDVIVTAGGMDIHGSGDLLRARSQYTVGDWMPMRVWRDGAYLDVVLQLLQSAN